MTAGDGIVSTTIVTGSLEADAGDEFEVRNARYPSKSTAPAIAVTNPIRIPPGSECLMSPRAEVNMLTALMPFSSIVYKQWACQSHFATKRETEVVRREENCKGINPAVAAD